MSLSQVSLLDPFVLITCGVFLYRNARLTSAHPGCMFLLFHAMFVTARLYSVMSGSLTLFSHWPGALPVSEQEIARAGLLADVALVSMTLGLVLSSRRDRRQTTRSFAAAEMRGAVLSARIVHRVSAVAFPIGILALLVRGAIPNADTVAADFGEWNTSSWLMVTQFWPILVLLALIYLYGFCWKFTVPLAMFLLLMSIEGFNRFRVVLPVIFLLITWQTRVGRRWPRPWMVVSFICLTLLVFPMKRLGVMVWQQKPMSDMVEVASDSFYEAVRGTSPDQMLLDQLASTLWLVDESGEYSYGRTYSSLLFLPIPRQLWPDKPILTWYWAEISNPSRPMYDAGMAPTLVGDAYLNFGLIGVVAVPFVFSYWIGKFYFVSMHKAYFSVCRFMYITMACCLIQILRDGLSSVLLFPSVNMMPLVAIAILSYTSFRRKRARNLLQSALVPGRVRAVARRSV